MKIRPRYRCVSGAALFGWALFITVGCGAAARPPLETTLDEELEAGPSGPARDGDALFEDVAHLDRVALVRAVLARSPSVEAARYAWRAALAHVDQETSLDDPMLMYGMAPASIASSDVPYGQTVELSQRFPFPGKLALRGAVAAAEADAVREGYDAVRLELALIASLLYDDYYVQERALEVNEHQGALVEELRGSAEARYASGQGSLQDPLQAETEAAELERERLVLEAERDVVVAQINGLLHRAPDLPLPRPPTAVEPPRARSETSAELRAMAFGRRPELRARAARIQRWQAARALAEREYFPDFELFGSYSSMWADPEHQFMVGVALEIPILLRRRAAAVREAEAELARERAELAFARDQLGTEVEGAFLRVRVAERVLRTYDERIVPAARARLAAARAGYEAGRNDFAAVIEAAEELRASELARENAVADVLRRSAALDRALGRASIARDAENGETP